MGRGSPAIKATGWTCTATPFAPLQARIGIPSASARAQPPPPAPLCQRRHPAVSRHRRNLDADEVARRRALKAPALRLKVPDEADPAGIITFNDRTYGAVSECLATDCGDFLIQRSDGVFAYQLVVTVDDEHMGVTEVVRGRDLLGSSARQIYLQDLLGYNHPGYAHVPLLAAPDGRRLSKRDRDCDMGELMARFGAPEKLLGHLSHIAGIAPDSSPRSVDQLVDLFNWRAISIHSADIVIGE